MGSVLACTFLLSDEDCKASLSLDAKQFCSWSDRKLSRSGPPQSAYRVAVPFLGREEGKWLVCCVLV